MPAILREEEDESYINEVGPDANDDLINRQHNAAVRTIAIGHIVDKVTIFNYYIWYLLFICLKDDTFSMYYIYIKMHD